MPIPILMPAVSPTMEEGKLAKWLVKEGDNVSSGDVIAEIETDKATMEVEAVEEGTVGKILVAEGTEGVAVNATIAMLLEEGEDKSALGSAGPTAQTSNSPEAKTEPDQAKNGDTPSTVNERKTVSAAQPQLSAANGQGGRVFASPHARRNANA